MPGDTTAERRTAEEPTEPIVVEFKTGDESEFQKPDHDPHGETCAAAAHSSTSCDNPECDTRGLVPTGVLEEASGFLGGPERDVVCSEECA
jgi:hypothetical protein